MAKCVLFDLDGTLLDSAPDLVHCAVQAAHEHGLAIDNVASAHHAISQGARGIMQHIVIDGQHTALFEQALVTMLNAYETSCYQHSKLYDGVTSLLTHLNEHAIAWGIVTNKSRRFTKPIVNAEPMLQDAQVCICPEDIAKPKPHPAGIEIACRILKYTPSECWYVGDDTKDLQAARAANCQFAFATYGYAAETPTDVDVQLNTPLDFLDLL